MKYNEREREKEIKRNKEGGYWEKKEVGFNRDETCEILLKGKKTFGIKVYKNHATGKDQKSINFRPSAFFFLDGKNLNVITKMAAQSIFQLILIA